MQNTSLSDVQYTITIYMLEFGLRLETSEIRNNKTAKLDNEYQTFDTAKIFIIRSFPEGAQTAPRRVPPSMRQILHFFPWNLHVPYQQQQ